MVLLNLFGEKKEKMSDIEYLAMQESLGNIKRMSKDISSLGETLEHTVPDRKDAYVLVAKITPSGFTEPALKKIGDSYGRNDNYNVTEAKVSINNDEKDRAMVGVATSAENPQGSNRDNGYGSLDAAIFDAVIGAKIGEKKTIKIENILSHGNCMAQLVLLEIDLGASPEL